MSYFEQLNLVADVAQAAKFQNTNVVNAWGIVSQKNGTFWATLNGTNLLGYFTAKGEQISTFPTADGPTGLAALPSGRLGGGTLILVSESGNIQEFIPSLANPVQTRYTDASAVYKGCTIYNGFLYAANFNNFVVDIFDISTNPYTKTGTLADNGLTIAGYSPFNVYADRSRLFISFALLDPVEKRDDLAGPGNGYLDVWSEGTLTRLANRGPLNSPWGMLRHNDLLYVGNFGDGFINVFQIEKVCERDFGFTSYQLRYLSPIKNSSGTPIQNDGLWGITSTRSRNGLRILFASGPQVEDLGLISLLSEIIEEPSDDC